MLKDMQDLLKDRFSVARQFNEEGKQIIGWICPYVPEEIIDAGGMLPLRITGDQNEIVKADTYLYTNICSYNRAALELGIKGDYDILDGFVTGNICDHIRRLYDVWSFYLEPPFHQILSVPHKITDKSTVHLALEFEKLKKNLEDLSGAEITQDAIKDSISKYNRTRSLLRELYDLRKDKEPQISGSEAMEVVKSSMLMPRADYNPMLEEVLEEVKSRDGIKSDVRLMISGSDLDDPSFMRLIEDCGGMVVTDDICTGSRYFLEDVENGEDPIMSLARRYLSPILCARTPHGRERSSHILGLAKKFDVDGIILESLKFCDLYGCDFPLMKEEFEEAGIPILILDREYTISGVEQIKTRIQAFIEQLGGVI